MILIIGIILLFIVFTTTISRRFNIPLIIALTVGILFGSDITGIVYFDNAKLLKSGKYITIFILLLADLALKQSNANNKIDNVTSDC